MKLSEKIAELQMALEKHGDIPCIYSADDEGNHFSEPNVGGILYVEGDNPERLAYDLEVMCESDYQEMLDEEEEEDSGSGWIKVYCIN